MVTPSLQASGWTPVSFLWGMAAFPWFKPQITFIPSLMTLTWWWVWPYVLLHLELLAHWVWSGGWVLYVCVCVCVFVFVFVLYRLLFLPPWLCHWGSDLIAPLLTLGTVREAGRADVGCPLLLSYLRTSFCQSTCSVCLWNDVFLVFSFCFLVHVFLWHL